VRPSLDSISLRIPDAYRHLVFDHGLAGFDELAVLLVNAPRKWLGEKVEHSLAEHALAIEIARLQPRRVAELQTTFGILDIDVVRERIDDRPQQYPLVARSFFGCLALRNVLYDAAARDACARTFGGFA
jgi:hypothetical protein